MDMIDKTKIKKALCYGLPLLMLPLMNIFDAHYLGQKTNIVLFSWETAFMLFWVSVEELVFRKMLPWGMEKYLDMKEKQIAVISSILFALFHFVNLFTGTDLSVTLVQVVFAFGVGYCFFALVKVCGSVIPGIIIHFFINLTGSFDQNEITVFRAIFWVILSIGCCIYGMRILKDS